MASLEQTRAANCPIAGAALAAIAIPALLSMFAFVVRVSAGPLTIDDAYITFRYARNVADGMGFVYNPGEHVIGTTTPAWTLLLAGFYRLGFHSLPAVALFLGASADAFTVILIIRLAMGLGFSRGWASFAAFLFAICPLSILYTTGGMETPLFTLLVLAAITADLEGHPALGGMAAGLSTVTRPEGALVFILIETRYVLSRHIPPARLIVSSAACVLPWYGFAVWWSGHILTQSTLAKAAHLRYPAVFTLIPLASFRPRLSSSTHAPSIGSWGTPTPPFLRHSFVGLSRRMSLLMTGDSCWRPAMLGFVVTTGASRGSERLCQHGTRRASPCISASIGTALCDRLWHGRGSLALHKFSIRPVWLRGGEL